MPAILVDSNILIDVLLAKPSEWSARSDDALTNAAARAPVIINPVIFAEVSVGFSLYEDAVVALPALLEREDIPYEAAFLAGKAYQLYRRRGGLRRSALPDFFIGAHAAIKGYELLTRDARRYRNYFPTVKLISP